MLNAYVISISPKPFCTSLPLNTCILSQDKICLAYYTFSETIFRLNEGYVKTLIPPGNTENAYCFWDIRAPDGFIISVIFQRLRISSRTDGKTFLVFGDNNTDFQGITNSCGTWINLTDEKGQLEGRYERFASRTSSIKFIFSSVFTEVNFSIGLSAIQLYGNRYWYSLQKNIIHSFSKCCGSYIYLIIQSYRLHFYVIYSCQELEVKWQFIFGQGLYWVRTKCNHCCSVGFVKKKNCLNHLLLVLVLVVTVIVIMSLAWPSCSLCLVILYEMSDFQRNIK